MANCRRWMVIPRDEAVQLEKTYVPALTRIDHRGGYQIASVIQIRFAFTSSILKGQMAIRIITGWESDIQLETGER